jgi:cyclopropane fatty-acyl-phospholipid synthase-like methyltransferase
MSSAAVWHEVECGGYSADLALWERLSRPVRGALLELGSGGGRVTLRLARQGREVWSVDSDASLIEALQADADAERLPVHTACMDVRALSLDREFELIIAPMQVLQMLGGVAGRRATLERVAAHLAPSGRLAAAIVEQPATAIDGAGAALPDVRERDGWVYSSLPTVVPTTGGDLEIRRLRQAVSPDGRLSEEQHTDRLDGLDAAGLEAEGARAGLRPSGRFEVPPSDGYLGSTVVVLGRP